MFGRLRFSTQFGEPVAQVMLHAAASGLPVVGPASMDTRSLVQDEVTATCYGTHSAEAVADAVLRGLASAEARRARAPPTLPTRVCTAARR